MSAERAGSPHRVVVVGAGVAGLTAAYELARRPGFAVTLLEGAPRTGGKLRRGEVGGVTTDLGAEAILARRPEALDLAIELGLGDRVLHPATTVAAVWSRGRLRPLPTGHVMGVPTAVRRLAASGAVSPAAVVRASLDLVRPGRGSQVDVSVGSFVGARLGREVVDRLVEPLLGGVYAGRADELSLRATLPQVAAAAGSGGSLMRALRVASAPASASAGPVFAGFAGGVALIAERLTAAASAAGVQVRLGTPARALERTPTGWRVVVGAAAAPAVVEADAVVLAVPAAAAARLLGSCAPAAAAELAGIDYASMAVVTLVFDAAAARDPLPGSGFLVPAVERRLVKAATFSSAKWGWYAERAPGRIVVRCSIGRYGDVADLQRDDDELITGARGDLGDAVGLRAGPLDAVVTRWGGALPQYAVGHLERIARIKQAIATLPDLAVCGAAYGGVGIPACIASARAAVAAVSGPVEDAAR